MFETTKQWCFFVISIVLTCSSSVFGASTCNIGTITNGRNYQKDGAILKTITMSNWTLMPYYCCATQRCVAWDCSTTTGSCRMFYSVSNALLATNYVSGLVTTLITYNVSSLGCYSNYMPANMSYSDGVASSLTNQVCANYCRSYGFKYSGTTSVSFVYYCRCANYLSGSPVASSLCNIGCPGDSSQACGASSYTSVYDTGLNSFLCSNNLPEQFLVYPTSLIISTTPIKQVALTWGYQIPSVFDQSCWCTSFELAVHSKNYNTTTSLECPFAKNPGNYTFTSIQTLSVNTPSNPHYTVTTKMHNYRDTSYSAKTSQFCIGTFPAAPTITAPSSSGYYFTNATDLTLSWNPPISFGYPCSADNIQYRIFIDTTTNPTTLIFKTPQTYFTWENVENEKTYYLIIEVDNNGLKTKSSEISFKTCFDIQPNAISSILPATGSHLSTGTHNSSVTISWSLSKWIPLSCASSLLSEISSSLYLSTDPSASVLHTSNLNYASASVTATLQIGTWYWKVIPNLRGDNLIGSPIYSFTIDGCGDGIINPTLEQCDGGEQCGFDCTCNEHWTATIPRSKNCIPKCGDSYVVGNETCDKGTGCQSNCQCNTTGGYYPNITAISINCRTQCNDSIIAGDEKCEQGGTGCDYSCNCLTCYVPNHPYQNDCKLQDGAFCTGHRSHYEEYAYCKNGAFEYQPCPVGYICHDVGYHSSDPCVKAICGDGIVSTGEDCDGGAYCSLLYCKCLSGYVPTGGNGCIAPIASNPSKSDEINPDDNNGGIGTNAIIGIAVGCIGFVVIASAAAVGLIVMKMKKKHKQEKEEMNAQNTMPVVFMDNTPVVLMQSSELQMEPVNSSGLMTPTSEI